MTDVMTEEVVEVTEEPEVEETKDKERDKQRLTAHEQLEAIITLYQKIARIFGHDIYRDDFTFNWRIKLSFAWTFIFALNCVYLFVYNILIGDREEMSRSICFFATSIQQQCKTMSIILNINDIKKCHERVETLTKTSKGKSERTIYELNTLFITLGKILFFVNNGSVVLLTLYPIYAYYVLGNERESIVNFFLPFVDHSTDLGYGINLFMQFLQIANTSSVYICVDALIAYYLLFAGAYEELVEYRCRLVNEAIKEAEKQNKHKDKKSQQKFHALLVDTIKIHQSMDEYIQTLKFFERWLLMQIGCVAYTLMACLFVVKLTGWFALYLFIIAYLYQLCAYSFLGTYIESKYEGLSAVIYEIPWYHLSIPDQKMLKFFLQKSQMPTKLYLMGEKSMNVETGLSILKTIYSVYIMLDTVY